jgi:hypothetical protein
MGAKISKNQRTGSEQSKPKGKTTFNYGPPLCGACSKKTRRLRKPKWSVCETGHQLYKLK